MKFLIDLLRGFSGHPSHPPLTDVSIGTYTAGTAFVVAGWLGFLPDKFPLAQAGFLAIAIGLIVALPTVITGFADYFSIPRGTGLRRMANIHWVVMASGTAAFLAAASLLWQTFDEGTVSATAALVTLGAFGLLVIGGYVGGTMVFEYGMRVVNVPENTPITEALKLKKFPPA